MDVLHFNYFSSSGSIYCERLNQVVFYDQGHHLNNCAVCPFFAGTLQGDGIECLYKDSTAPRGKDFMLIYEPYEFYERRRKALPIEMEKEERKFIVKK